LVGVGGVIVVCIDLGRVSGSDDVLWMAGLGVFVWGVLLVGMHGSGGVIVEAVSCELLILLESSITLGLTAGFCVSGGVLSLVVSLSGIRM